MSELASAAAAGTLVNEQPWRAPAEGLRGLVNSYVGFRQAGLEPARHRGLPSPWLTLIFTLDQPLILAAHPCGYFDQAHLDREFGLIAGCPPTTWLNEEFRNLQAPAA